MKKERNQNDPSLQTRLDFKTTADNVEYLSARRVNAASPEEKK